MNATTQTAATPGRMCLNEWGTRIEIAESYNGFGRVRWKRTLWEAGEIHYDEGKLEVQAIGREIVASVNACRDAGISVEALENGALNAMVEAVKASESALAGASYSCNDDRDRFCYCQRCHAWRKVRAALAAIQPQE